MSILQEIKGWAKKQAEWKQEAIRRIVKNGDFEDKDIEDISSLILKKHGYLDEIPSHIQIESLDKLDSFFDKGKKRIILQKIESLKNVNALCPNSKLRFALNGLTIIYGENGTGKSGYSRILKKSCKARKVDSILPDVFNDAGVSKISANIFYSVDGKNTETEWNANQNIDILEEFVVFDSKCGKIQVIDKNELIYLPHGTDIFKKLINLIIEVRKELEKKKPKEIKLNLYKINENSSIFKFIKNLTKETSDNIVEQNLAWDDKKDEKECLDLSRKILESNEEEVKKNLSKIDKEIQSLQRIQSHINDFEKIATKEKIDNVFTLIKNCDESKEALDNLANEMKEEIELEGTGKELWRVLYDAAKEFSTKSAYPNQVFPYTGGICILCQQQLDENSKQRFLTFQKFAEGHIKNNLDDISSKIEAEKTFLKKAESKFNDGKSLLDNEFSCVTSEQKNEIIKHFTDLNDLRKNLLLALWKNENVPDEIQENTLFFEEKLSSYIESSKQKKEEIAEVLDIENLKKMESQKSEYDSRKIASSKTQDIKDYISYLREADKFKSLIKETDFSAISKKGSAIITSSLGDSFFKSLSDELSKLGGEEIPLLVNSSTIVGRPTFQLSLEGANMPTHCKIDAVLSEGEQKISSLAGLLAELDTVKHENALILDDPVTSLDHQFRSKIAKRLVKEAEKRQVIIFTHDIAFLFELNFYAKKLNIPTFLQNMRKDGKKSGVISSLKPWHAQNVSSKLETIRGEVSNLSKENLNKEIYNQRVGGIYGRLRETWERVVEEVLFNKVVTRFAQGVQTKRLNKVYIDDDDYSLIYFEMSKCSKHMIGHDKSLVLTDARPAIDEIYKDIDKINKFVMKINKRNIKVEKTRKKKVEKIPLAEVMK